MRHERALGILILSELALIVLGAVAEHTLSPPLDTAPARGPLLTGLWVVAATGTVLAWIALLYLLREGRILYLGTWVVYLVLTLLRGPVADSAVGSVLQSLTALVGGAILSLVYGSELRTRFRSLRDALRPGGGTST
jgi:hypothetical protein